MKNLKLYVCLLGVVWFAVLLPTTSAFQNQPAQEAPAGFDDRTNGLVSQAVFDADKATFEEQDSIADGLGPCYNAQACSECHQNPTTGGISQVTVLRAGHFDGANFIEHPGGSLINDRAINADIQERVLGGYEVKTFRTSLNTLGDGYVEAIADDTLIALANSQPANMRGQIIRVPVLEARNATRVGRFGWKNQHASLLSFSGDAYLNEIGITNRLFLFENTSNGRSLDAYDTVPDPAPNGEDGENDIEIFAEFMRATKAPPRAPGSETLPSPDPDVVAGSNLFNQIGCNICHVRTIVTAPVGTRINGGTFTVPQALGNKIIHPFSDFLLHDVGTGDGIVQNGGASTRNKLRTPPLWGLRTRSRLMHDGASQTRSEAIQRHAGEASGVIASFNALRNRQRDQLIKFLNTL